MNPEQYLKKKREEGGQRNETTEIKILRKISQKSLKNKIRSATIRDECKITPVNNQVIEWNNYGECQIS